MDHTPGMVRYVIQGGQVGYERLQLLARTRAADTAALLDRVGVMTGWRCIDLGCGSGDVAFELAHRVGPDGQVVGIDADAEQLALVRAAAARTGVTNVELLVQDIDSWHARPEYDLVYARFVLQHLADPVSTLARMWAAVRPGGALVVEDADFAGLVAFPPDPGYDFYAEHYPRALATNGGDPSVGQKLFGYFRAVGVSDIQLAVRQGVHVGSDEGKRLPASTLATTADAIVAAGLATPEHVARAVDTLTQFAARPDSLLSGPRIFQIWGRRSADR